MDRGTWQTTVYGVAKSQTWLKLLSTQHRHLTFLHGFSWFDHSFFFFFVLNSSSFSGYTTVYPFTCWRTSFGSVRSLSRVQLFATPWLAARQASRCITNSRSSLKQTQVRQIGDAIQPSHPLSSPFPPAPIPSQHQSLFQWVNSSHEVAKVLEFQL